MTLCLLCDKEKERFVDNYICVDCAKESGLQNPESRRSLYSIAIGLFRSASRANYDQNGKAYTITGKDDDEKMRKHQQVLVYNPLASLHNTSMFLYQSRMFEKIQSLDGDIVECGVGIGQTLIGWLSLVWSYGQRRRVWGFDSFEGFPESTSEDKSYRDAQKGDFWALKGVIDGTNVTPLDIVVDSISNYGLTKEWLSSILTLIQGWFKDSLTHYDGQIALLHIDADLYQSYRNVLEILGPKVVPGGLILFDEYLGTMEFFNFPGAKKAVDEYFAKTPGYSCVQRDPYRGKYYVRKMV